MAWRIVAAVPLRRELRPNIDLSGPAHYADRHRGGRRRDRRGGARGRPRAQQGLGPAGHRREPRRRRPYSGRAKRRQSRPGRLHAHGRRGRHLHHQPDRLSARQAALRHRSGFRADQRPRPHQPGADRRQQSAGRQCGGADRARQAKARTAHLRHRRHRLGAAHEHGAVREHGGRQAAGGALSRRRARAQRSAPAAAST